MLENSNTQASADNEMAIRENIVASAVNFLQNPNVTGSPIENRIAFLESKNLTKEEINVALARVNRESSVSNYTNYNAPQKFVQPPVLGGYQQYPWQPVPPQRDWRDWFVAATVMSSLGFGLYNVVKRYVYPIIAPPTTPQLEQDKKEIDESFEKVFSLLDQLAKDTEELKISEQNRTAKLDVALTEVENTLSNLKSSSRRREEESRRITDEVHGLRNLIPKAMEEQKEIADTQLKELNTELKSLKLLLGQRMNSSASTNLSQIGRTSSTLVSTSAPLARNTSTDVLPNEIENKPSTPSTDAPVNDGKSPTQVQASNYFSKGKATIPAWQMTGNRNSSVNKSNSSVVTDTSGSS